MIGERKHKLLVIDNIIAARKHAGLTQTELSTKVGSKAANLVSKIEIGERNVKAHELFVIAEACGCHVHDLIKVRSRK